MYKLILILSMLFISGCQTTEDSNNVKYSKEEAVEIETIYKGCVISNIKEIDDGKSDARTIASAVSVLCRNEYERMLMLYAQEENNLRAKELFLRNASRDTTEIIVPMVLKIRAGKV